MADAVRMHSCPRCGRHLLALSRKGAGKTFDGAQFSPWVAIHAGEDRNGSSCRLRHDEAMQLGTAPAEPRTPARAA